ncbi:MAG: hypothetical protein SPI18_04020 [Prevotella sp.]|nr:hypothetical protein [Prevotella sp.]MDY6130434.1 hypothetical protein [Prevotella sp.]
MAGLQETEYDYQSATEMASITYDAKMSVVHHARLKDFSIYDSVQEMKRREQEEFAEAIRQYGEKVDDGYEWHFEGECPIVAAYDYERAL